MTEKLNTDLSQNNVAKKSKETNSQIIMLFRLGDRKARNLDARVLKV